MKTPKPRPKTTGELIGLRLQPDLLALVDKFRRKESDLPSRPEAMRRLVAEGLKAKGIR